jgi:diguanylate cyclase (GGDEF)-like protein
MAAPARETSGATTCLIARYVRDHAGQEGLARVHARSRVQAPIEALEDERRWFTYEDKIALFEAAAVVLDDPEVTRRMGESVLKFQVGAGLRVLLRTLGSPRVVLSNIAKANSKFSTVAKMEAIELGRTDAVVRYQLSPDKAPHRLDCLYNQGLLSVVGPLFGLPLLAIEHRECQVLGAPSCIYRVHWPRRHLRRRHEREANLIERSAGLAAQLHAFQSTAADLVSADDISEVLERIVARAGVAVSAPRYLLAVRDTGGRLLVRSDGFASPADEERVAGQLLAGRDMGDRALVQKVASTRRDYGVIAAFYDSDSFFDYERGLLEAYARHAAAALDMVGALDEARRRSAETAALLGLATALAELATPEQMAQQVAEAMRSVMAAQATIVAIIEDDRLTIRGITGAPNGVTETLTGTEIEAGVDEPMLAWLASGEPRLVHADTDSPIGRTMLSTLGIDSLLLVPIHRRGELLGATGAGFVGTAPDAAGLLSLSIAVAEHAAIALDNANLLARLSQQALYDDLTGAASPSHFEEEGQRALARAVRDHSDISMMFVDLDCFKEINDKFGHPVGNQVLRQVALRLRSQLRIGDTVGRLGGDEFAVLLCGVGPQEAMAAAERMRHAIQQPLVGHPDVCVSASIGVATALRGGSTYENLVKLSDTAMYRAKHAGRNTCVAVDAA